MEDSYFRHPLDKLNQNHSTFMLESMIPFVDYPYKVPLALFVKFLETQSILQNLRNIEKVNSCGLHNTGGDILDIISSFSSMNPEMLSQMQSMMQMYKMMQSMNDIMPSEGSINPNVNDMMASLKNMMPSSAPPFQELFPGNLHIPNVTDISNYNVFEENVSEDIDWGARIDTLIRETNPTGRPF